MSTVTKYRPVSLGIYLGSLRGAVGSTAGWLWLTVEDITRIPVLDIGGGPIYALHLPPFFPRRTLVVRDNKTIRSVIAYAVDRPLLKYPAIFLTFGWMILEAILKHRRRFFGDDCTHPDREPYYRNERYLSRCVDCQKLFRTRPNVE